MTTYAIAQLRDIDQNAEIVEYLQEIDATLAPFGGRFLVHGATAEVLEGSWPGDVVVVGFPDAASARDWYASEAYQRILPLRTRNAACDVILVEGCSADHRATELLATIG